mmetsp:Transcript_6747/g.8049  ORF Transcript_6747/g.8049 Transcript_6747/m.8049 type:complete len:128 (+) Transcript_6747:1418-1801(+)
MMEQLEEEVEDERSDAYTLLVWFVNNLSRQDTRFTIVWNQQSRDKVNFRMPATDFTDVISAGKQSLPIKLQKLRLDEDWGDYLNFVVMIDSMTGEKFNRFDQDYPHIRSQKLPLMEAAELERQMMAA